MPMPARPDLVVAAKGTGIRPAADADRTFAACHERADPAILEWLLSEGSDPNQTAGKWRDMLGWTLLHEAATYGTGRQVAALLKAGADVDAVDATGRTPLHWALWQGRSAAAAELFAASSSQSRKCDDGMTPMMYAARYGGLGTISDVLRSVGTLRVLDIGGCGVGAKDAAQIVSACRNLEALELADNDVGPGISSVLRSPLGKLRRLGLRRNNLGDTGAAALTELLTAAPAVGDELRCVSSVDIGENNIRVMPLQLITLSRLEDLRIDGNPLANLPRAVHSLPRDQLVQYLADCQKAVEALRYKVMVVGKGKAGKTSLLRCMEDASGGASGALPAGTAGAPSVQTSTGVTVAEEEVMVTMPSGSRAAVSIRFFDFAGQGVYGASHSIVLSPRTLYLLVWDVTEASRSPTGTLEFGATGVEDWLKIILAKDDRGHFLLVGNKVDRLKKTEDATALGEDFLSYFASTVAKVNPMLTPEAARSRVVGSVLCSCANRIVLPHRLDASLLAAADAPKQEKAWGFDTLRRYTAAVGAHLMQSDAQYGGGLVPQSYLRLASAIESLSTGGTDGIVADPVQAAVLSWEQFQQLASRFALFGDSLAAATTLLHSWGVLLHFPDNPALKNVVFTDTQLICRIVAALFSFHHWLAHRAERSQRPFKVYLYEAEEVDQVHATARWRLSAGWLAPDVAGKLFTSVSQRLRRHRSRQGYSGNEQEGPTSAWQHYMDLLQSLGIVFPAHPTGPESDVVWLPQGAGSSGCRAVPTREAAGPYVVPFLLPAAPAEAMSKCQKVFRRGPTCIVRFAAAPETLYSALVSRVSALPQRTGVLLLSRTACAFAYADGTQLLLRSPNGCDYVLTATSPQVPAARERVEQAAEVLKLVAKTEFTGTHILSTTTCNEDELPAPLVISP
eukprot:TRINITY_DN36398_c0_g1_i1.p1 TRINITY_DN36398_c0_g1~~TRINITY_DN36398_c0_g1_i1.p1  ORF type:complete len:927 (+),score=234.41 TRINITY_DN36398_c0_g1_i1:68-2782(+)